MGWTVLESLPIMISVKWRRRPLCRSWLADESVVDAESSRVL